MSKKPSNERKALYEMPMQKAAKQVAAHLNEGLKRTWYKKPNSKKRRHSKNNARIIQGKRRKNKNS